ncbi:hypothetical protein [Agrococcus sp. Marseille-Q4369]|uniref:VG15 protein n=1 Tax=Agrococcus sp. Marseille-Q4369 TaxID=2810513 RepID=UPI001B8CE4AD|nr:hypothetical protein [Agrococcus sp. Marseille-Q4369]QUW18886.1 hypothetical protein JSQ78_00430 [Agrococcus sp. Marseille-Q4369]
MARTAEGRRLTEAHRRQQLAIAAKAEVAARRLWPRLDVADLDRSEPAWLASNLAVYESMHRDSAALAARYVPMYRDAELGDPAGPTVSAPFARAETTAALHIAGPVAVKQRIAKGVDPREAHAGGIVALAGIARRQVLRGGRLIVDRSTRADGRAVGWRRVTDGDPCPFCGMLASRGPVYGSRQRAQEIGGSGLRYHGGCGCTAEIVYGGWEPNAAEQRFIERYEAAAAEVDAMGLPRVEKTVLPILRRDWPA